MVEYTDRDKIMKILQRYSTQNNSSLGLHSGAVDCAMEEIDMIEPADVEPVRHGHWKGFTQSRFFGCDTDGNPIYRDGVIYYCSRCDQRSIIKSKFCAGCGAKMDGGDEADENRKSD